VLKDRRIRLASSPEPWRLITYSARREHRVEFLTNALDLVHGVIALS
jgi:hypothetical protein